jgi:hypothetical protein
MCGEILFIAPAATVSVSYRTPLLYGGSNAEPNSLDLKMDGAFTLDET